MQYKKGDSVQYCRHMFKEDEMFFNIGKSYKVVRVMGSWLELSGGPHEKPFVTVEALSPTLLQKIKRFIRNKMLD